MDEVAGETMGLGGEGASRTSPYRPKSSASSSSSCVAAAGGRRGVRTLMAVVWLAGGRC